MKGHIPYLNYEEKKNGEEYIHFNSNIKEALSYKEQTNIYSTNEVSPTFKVKAYGDTGLILDELKQAIVGWINYFKIANMGIIVQRLDEWIRRRIRMCYWKQWKKIKTKHDNLIKLGIDKYKAWEYANTRKSYWRISDTPFLHQALNNKTLERFGYTSLSSVYC